MAKKISPNSQTKEQKFLDKALKNLKKAVDADDHNRSAALEDLRFVNGDQWDNFEKQRRSRSGRPCLQTNFLPKFVQMMVGEQRMNRPKIKVTPADSRADVHLAKIREGIVSNIEYLSNSRQIYDTAFESMVTCGYGAWRVLTRYTEEDPFLQEIYMEGIRNPFQVYMDPAAKDKNYADANWGIILEKMPRSEFEERYPNAQVPGDTLKVGKGLGSEIWYDKESVTVAEYFEKSYEKQVMCLMDDGEVLSEDEADNKIREWREKADREIEKMLAPLSPLAVPSAETLAGKPLNAPATPSTPAQQGQTPTNQMPLPGVTPMSGPTRAPGGGPILPGSQPPSPTLPGSPGPQTPLPPTPPGVSPQTQGPQRQRGPFGGEEPKIVRKRVTEIVRIKQYIISAVEIIDGPNDFPGKFIPIILLKGMERNIEGKNYVRGIIRDAKDTQKLINFWVTNAAETIALAPKTPWVGTAKQFEGYEADYAQANTENLPFLKYNPDSEAQGPPQRVPTAQPPMAVFEQIRKNEENLQSILGMSTPDQAQQGPERTGAAVINKRNVSDVGNFAYYDNLTNAVAYCGRVIVEMIPEVYDTERDVRLRNVDDTEVFVPINSVAGDAMSKIRKEPERYIGMDLNRLRKHVNAVGENATFNDMTVGKYDVVVTTGPSYTTQRQEAVANLMQLTQAMPQQMAIGADLIVGNMDFRGSDELSERLRRQLPPGLIKQRPGEPPQPPLPPPPQVQLQQAKIQLEQEKTKHAQLKAQLETQRVELERAKLGITMQGGKQDVRKLVLEVLSELYNSQAPPPQPSVM